MLTGDADDDDDDDATLTTDAVYDAPLCTLPT